MAKEEEQRKINESIEKAAKEREEEESRNSKHL